jgi:hypothetical protein
MTVDQPRRMEGLDQDLFITDIRLIGFVGAVSSIAL